jgi:hypothetical protein
MNRRSDIGELQYEDGDDRRPAAHDEGLDMRVMPYATYRGAMLLGDAPADSPFDGNASVPSAGLELTRRFELTSGDTGTEAPGRFTRGAERGWRSLRPVSRRGPFLDA